MKFAHIVNPVKVPESSDLFVAQPVTFRSMLAAKQFVKGRIDVELQAVCFDEDTDLIPDCFKRLSVLERSVLDIGKFAKQRKLPLLKDILDRSVYNTDADYIIYTNVDIGLQPFFYEQIEQYLKQYDALVVNRRTIAKCDDSSKPLSYFYLQRGREHPGFDCFIFKRKSYGQYQLYDACIGANWIGRILICNLLCFAQNPFIEKNAFLTFHIGDDRCWKTIDNIDYDEHNERQLVDLMKHLKGLGRIDSHDLLQRTYKEFVLKTQDPDFTRPKRVLVTPDVEQRKSEIKAKTIHSQSLSMDYDDILPDIYMPSSSWEGTEGLALRQDPIFIVGHPRSGTSLLQSLIATQVTPVVFPETHFFSIVRSLIKVEEDRILKDCLKEVLSFLKEKLVLSTEFEKYITKSIQNNILSPKMLFEAIVFDQLSQKNDSGNDIGKIRWIEKTPDHAEFLDVILRFYPSSKIVFVVRNPEKAIISRRKHFTWNNEAEWPIEKHIDRWLQTINAVKLFEKQHPQSIISVKFEDVIENQNLAIRSICKYLDVPFNSVKVNDYKSYSRQQTLPWETWKDNTTQGLSLNIALRKDTVLNTNDKLFLGKKLEPFLSEYGYFYSESKEKTEKKNKEFFKKSKSLVEFQQQLYKELNKKDNERFEAILENFYSLILKSGDIAIDVGAHKGRHTFPMAKCVGNKGKVYAFEPIPQLESDLREMIMKKSLSHIIDLFPCALSDKIGDSKFLIVEGAYGLSGLKKRTSHEGYKLNSIVVKVEKLDSILPTKNRIRFIKVDAEGADFYILKGAINILKTIRPIVVFECGKINSLPAESYNYSQLDFDEFFKMLDYKLFDIAGFKYNNRFWDKPTLNDLVAIPNECYTTFREFLLCAASYELFIK